MDYFDDAAFDAGAPQNWVRTRMAAGGVIIVAEACFEWAGPLVGQDSGKG